MRGNAAYTYFLRNYIIITMRNELVCLMSDKMVDAVTERNGIISRVHACLVVYIIINYLCKKINNY